MPVDAKHQDYSKMAGKWSRCRDAMNGQDAVHAAGTAYLPRLKEQEELDYQSYKQRATFYNATWRTVSGLKGMIMRKQPIVDVPESVKELLKDVTLSGVPLTLFIDAICEEALGLGRIGVLVDYPTVNVVGMTQADAQRLNLRPTMQLYKCESIVNWRTGTVNNKTVLTMVVLKECAATPKDEFEDTYSDQYRVLDLDPTGSYRVRVFVKSAAGKDVQVGTDVYPLMTGAKMDYIPFVIIGTDDVTPDVDEPPLIDLVDVNLSHYRTNADYEHAAHFTGLPTPVITGYRPENLSEKLYIGSSAAWILPNENARATFLEYTGTGLTALRTVLQDKEQQMAVLGARMLEPMKKAQESPDSASIRRKGEESMLSAAAMAIGLGVTIALRWFVDWTGADSTDVEAELNQDFYPVPMSAEMLTALVAGWQAKAYSDQVLFDNLQRGEIIDENTTLEEEQEARQTSGPDLAPGADPGGAPSLAGTSRTITTPEGRKYVIQEA